MPRHHSPACAVFERLSLVSIVSLALAGFSRGESKAITFEEIANGALGRLGMPAGAEPESFEYLIDRSCHRVELGVFDLRFPSGWAASKRDASMLRSVAADLVELQQNWARWSLADEAGPAVEDLDTLARWTRTWSPKDLRGLDLSEHCMMEQLDASSEVREACSRLQTTLLSAFSGGGEGRLARLVVVPNREVFLDLVALAGLCDPSERDSLWDPSTWTSTGLWVDETQIVPFEWPAWPFDPGNPTAGVGIEAYQKGALRQHTIDRGVASFFAQLFSGYEPVVESALGANLVIATCGENDLEFGATDYRWSREGGSTQAYTGFVSAGGAPGGPLPKRKAKGGSTVWQSLNTTNSWRTTKGSDYFGKPLRKAQKSGAKLASKNRDLPPDERKDKLAYFTIKDGDGASRMISAPFLGEPGDAMQAPPDEFIADFEEFFRAYRSCFFEWIRLHGIEGHEDVSRAQFAQLIQRLAMRRTGESLDGLVLELYGMPLSSTRDIPESLEWRFLGWLARRR